MEKMEQIFTFIDHKAEEIEKSGKSTYLEAVLATLRGILDGDYPFPVEAATKEEVRKAIQLAILKGMRESSQPNHQMTPDSLGLLIAFIIEQLFEEKLEKGMISILDPALGTGNLMFTIMNKLDGKILATGVEVDELLIQLAGEIAEWIEQPIELYHQDALRPLLVEPVDLVVCDLPVGYYPNNEVAKDYELRAQNEMSYAHHLYIEQSLRYIKEGGYLIFLIPATLFESEQAEKLHQFLKKHAWIQAVMQLPETMFKSKQHEKSIFILQKKCDQLRPPKEVLLAKVPKLSNKQALSLFFEKIKTWKENNLNNPR
ncbi:class I SAM-dependent methyltransferase [Ureibacillus thermophilus]|uniref:class I SAM-dependent methyltransferase n=1 Tax=Ureibacillus thermophilus TaxID=367743 RepID=UPI00360FB2C6